MSSKLSKLFSTKPNIKYKKRRPMTGNTSNYSSLQTVDF